jgi:hypothetical protein
MIDLKRGYEQFFERLNFMKFCPNCQSQYTDDTLKFCLQDGTPLQEALFTQLPSEAEAETETVVAPRPPGQAYIPRETDPARRPAEPIPAAKKSKTTTAVFLTIFAMLLFFSLAGLGAWFYFNGLSTDKNANLILANKATNSERAATPPRPEATKTPSATPATNTEANANSAPAAVDREQITKDVSSRISAWNAQGEELDLDAYMGNYAGTVDYYNKKGASLAFVRGDKERAFGKYDSIKTNLSNITVTPDATGERATALFDKEWKFSGEESYSAGKVRQQLQLRKINGQWLITGERDLKVYYIE